MNEPQELHCHNCDRYVRFNLDLSYDGNYLLVCPVCGHEHYRVVRDGQITDVRWGQDPSQNNWTSITATSTSTTSSHVDYGSSYGSSDNAIRMFLHDSWAASSSTTSY